MLLTTTPGMASLWLIPRLPLFTRQHPGIDVRLVVTANREALVARVLLNLDETLTKN